MFSAKLDQNSWHKYTRTLQRLADATGKPVENVLRQQGRLLANDLAFRIKPMGVSPQVGKSYVLRIQSFILSIYRPIGWLHSEIEKKYGTPAADGVAKMIHRGRFAEARKKIEGDLRPHWPAVFFAVGDFDGGQLHREWRWKRRRRYPVMVLTDAGYREAKAYALETARTAGFAKAALINAGRQLDGKVGGTKHRAPKWITRHTSSPGRGVLYRSKNTFRGWVESFVRYGREALPPSEEAAALRTRAGAAEQQLRRIVDANIRRAMRGA